MKTLLRTLCLLSLLSLTAVFFAGCETDGKSQVKEGTSEIGDSKPTEDDGYPPPPKAIANAEFELIDGEKFSLADAKGKVVLINLWAIWCGPCINEMPHLREMEEKYKDKGFMIVGLNTGNEDGPRETKENIEKFVERQKLNYRIGWSERPITEEFFRLGRMSGIPQSFLINRKGKLTGIFQGGSNKVIIQMKENVEKIVNAS